jgi:hypothetical protein
MKGYIKFLLVAACYIAVTFSQASAQASPVGWSCQTDPNDCLGVVKMTVAKGFGPGRYIFTSFPNREYLFEDVTSGNSKKVFYSGKTNRYVFFGIKDKNEAIELQRLFQGDAGMSIYSILTHMAGAFPDGENEMPIDWQTRQSEDQGTVFSVAAKKSGNRKFLFRIMHPEWQVEGEWDSNKPAAWPDDTPMDGWTSFGTGPTSLADIRKERK